MAIDVITDNTTIFAAMDFFNNRATISNSMLKSLNLFFNLNCYASVTFFQLKTISLPDAFEDSI